MQNVGKNDPRGNAIVGSGELFCSRGATSHSRMVQVFFFINCP